MYKNKNVFFVTKLSGLNKVFGVYSLLIVLQLYLIPNNFSSHYVSHVSYVYVVTLVISHLNIIAREHSGGGGGGGGGLGLKL